MVGTVTGASETAMSQRTTEECPSGLAVDKQIPVSLILRLTPPIAAEGEDGISWTITVNGFTFGLHFMLTAT